MNNRLLIEDAIILIKLKCIENNLELIDFDNSMSKFSDKFLNVNAILTLKCLIDSFVIITTFNWFINNGIKCKKCTENMRLKLVNEKCNAKNYKLLSGTIINTTRSRLQLMCGLDKHIWSCSYDSFIRLDSNCPKCAKSATQTTDEATNVILNKCIERSYTFNGFVDKCFKNVYGKVLLKCSHNHDWIPSYYNFIYKNHKCPKCQKVHAYTKDEMRKIIESECEFRDYNFIGFIGEYKTTRSKIILNCKEHGNWNVSCTNFIINKTGCPNCSNNTNSNGEKIIENYLKQNNVEFNKQYRFHDCKNRKRLPFDFYLPKYNMCIEFDGQQHFHSIDFWGGVTAFNMRLINDKIKTLYCINNHVELLRIKYDENIIEKLNISMASLL
jgi:hypothetical protein